MRRLLLSTFLSSISLVAGSRESVAQNIELGEASLRFEATGRLLYLSNPYLRENIPERYPPIESSVGFVVQPSGRIEIGNNQSPYQARCTAAVDIRRLASLEELNAEDLSLSLHASHKGDRIRWRADASSVEFSLPEHSSRFYNFSPRGTSERLNLKSSYRYSPRTRLDTGLTFSNRSYKDREDFDFKDHRSISMPFRAFYRISDLTEIGAGVRYRKRNYEGSVGLPDDLAWHLALDGKISSKIEADLKIGILDEIGYLAHTIEDEGRLFLSTRASWSPSSQTKLTLRASSDTDSSGISDSILSERISLAPEWNVSNKLIARAQLEFAKESYNNSKRQDDSQTLSASLSYKPDSQFIFSIDLNFQRNESNSYGFSYEATSLNWTGGWRF